MGDYSYSIHDDPEGGNEVAQEKAKCDVDNSGSDSW